MKIALIGAGNVGSALGRLWAAKGHEILFCVPDPDSPSMSSWSDRSARDCASASMQVIHSCSRAPGGGSAPMDAT